MPSAKVTICVPMFNAAATIARCAASLFAQTVAGVCEFIFVDDGSSDGTPAVLREALSVSPDVSGRTRIIESRENGGPHEARMAGLRAAAGEYLMFVDADDTLAADAVEKSLALAERTPTDIVLFGAVGLRAGGVREEIRSEYGGDRDRYLLTILSGKKMGSACWKLFRTGYLRGIHFLCVPHCRYAEDMIFVVQALLATDRIAEVDECLYLYDRTNAASLTTAPQPRIADDLAAVFALLDEIVPDDEQLRRASDAGKIEMAMCSLKNAVAVRHFEPNTVRGLCQLVATTVAATGPAPRIADRIVVAFARCGCFALARLVVLAGRWVKRRLTVLRGGV